MNCEDCIYFEQDWRDYNHRSGYCSFRMPGDPIASQRIVTIYYGCDLGKERSDESKPD